MFLKEDAGEIYLKKLEMKLWEAQQIRKILKEKENKEDVLDFTED